MLHKLEWRISRPRPPPSSFGTCTASRDILSAQRLAKLVRRYSARILELNDTQEGVLEIVFRNRPTIEGSCFWTWTISCNTHFYCRESERNLDALRFGKHRVDFRHSARLVTLERDGEITFSANPLELADLMRGDMSGRGVVNILAADQLILKPRLYSSFLLWLMSELFENLPEVGDLDKPKLVFFFRRSTFAV